MLRYLYLIAFVILLGCSAEADRSSDSCSLEPDPGPCKASIERFFYNKQTNSCEVFIWGGCDGVVPFETLLACEQSCMPEQVPDEPVCEFEGSFYEIGDSWFVDCNTCICNRVDLNAPPEVVCTEMACANSTIGVETLSQEYPYTVTLKLGESKEIPAGSITFTQIEEDNRCPEDANCVLQGSAKVYLRVEQTETTPATLFIDVDDSRTEQADIYIYDLYLQLKQLHPPQPAEGKIADDEYTIELLIDKNTGSEGAIMKPVNTDAAPKAIGPYSQAIESNGLLFISGQIPIDPSTQDLQLFDGDITLQTELVLNNIKNILEAKQLGPHDVIKTTIYIADMEQFPLVNEVYANFFKNHKPARAAVGIAALPKGALIEVEAIARTQGD